MKDKTNSKQRGENSFLEGSLGTLFGLAVALLFLTLSLTGMV